MIKTLNKLGIKKYHPQPNENPLNTILTGKILMASP